MQICKTGDKPCSSVGNKRSRPDPAAVDHVHCLILGSWVSKGLATNQTRLLPNGLLSLPPQVLQAAAYDVHFDVAASFWKNPTGMLENHHEARWCHYYCLDFPVHQSNP